MKETPVSRGCKEAGQNFEEIKTVLPYHRIAVLVEVLHEGRREE